MDNTEETQNPQNPQEKDSNKLTIEVRRFQNLLEILKDRKKVLTLSLAITATGILLFCGITLIVLSIKRLYPYNDITTNAMGTTTLRSENKDVSYFLLNSAELWAKSGIRVKEGQTITIKSSGKKHSAIHHLIRDAEQNMPKLRDPWVGSEGFPEDFDTREQRDGERARYRIFPNTNQDILLMQVVKDGAPCIDRPIQGKENNNRFYVVGNKMEDFHIDMNGTLYFAVNDIVLDDTTIIRMLLECDTKYDTYNKEKRDSIIKDKVNTAQQFRETTPSEAYQDNSVYSSFLETLAIELNKTHVDSTLSVETTLILNMDPISNVMDTTRIIDSIYNKRYSYGPCRFGMGPHNKFIELYGYFMHHYQEAWYEDNVGSFLIIVEKEND